MEEDKPPVAPQAPTATQPPAEAKTAVEAKPVAEAKPPAEKRPPYEVRLPSWEDLRSRLQQSKFRSRFKLRDKEMKYLERKGMEVIHAHALEFVTTRVAPASPNKEGKQTPMRGHPVFVAQHATATCCRGCLFKWHRIPQGRELTKTEIEYIVGIIVKWVAEDAERRRNMLKVNPAQTQAQPGHAAPQPRRPFGSAILKRQMQQEQMYQRQQAPHRPQRGGRFRDAPPDRFNSRRTSYNSAIGLKHRTNSAGFSMDE
jgi:hypothetical protein